jgi:hypothetical protein
MRTRPDVRPDFVKPWLAPNDVIIRLVAAVFLLQMFIVVGFPPASDLLIAFAALWAAIAFHELGHAVVALTVGHHVFEVRVGAGPSLPMHVGRTRLHLGLIPAFGYVMSVSDKPSAYRVKRLLIGASGIVVNAGLAWWMLSRGIRMVGFEAAFFFFNVAGAFGSLIPLATKTPGGPLRPDIVFLFRTLFASPLALDEERAMFHAVDHALGRDVDDLAAVRREIREGLEHHPDSPALRGWLGLNLLRSERYAEARAVLESLAHPAGDAGRNVEPHVRAMYQNDLAWADLMVGDERLVDEADTASARAIEVLPIHPGVMRTRAFALIRTGRMREGVSLAERAYARLRLPRDRAVAAAIAAIGHALDYRIGDAERWLARAAGLDAECPLLDTAFSNIEHRRHPAPEVIAELDGPRPPARGWIE